MCAASCSGYNRATKWPAAQNGRLRTLAALLLRCPGAILRSHLRGGGVPPPPHLYQAWRQLSPWAAAARASLRSLPPGDHLSDGRPFDGPGGDIAHSYPGKYTHFDAAESWYVGPAGSATGFQLTAVRWAPRVALPANFRCGRHHPTRLALRESAAIVHSAFAGYRARDFPLGVRL